MDRGQTHFSTFVNDVTRIKDAVGKIQELLF